MGLRKEESGERTKRTWESFKLSEKESEAKKKNAGKKKGNREQMNCAQDVTQKKKPRSR